MQPQQTFVWQSPPPAFMGVPIASTSSGMAVTFANESKIVATLVNFDGNNVIVAVVVVERDARRNVPTSRMTK